MSTSGQTPAPIATPRNRRSRLRLVVWAVGSVLVLAAVIFAVSALSAPKRVPDLPEVQVAAAQSRKDYTEALSALASGETTRATQLLERAVAADPGNSAARKKLDELKTTPLPSKSAQQQPANPSKAPAGTTPAATPGAAEDSGTQAPAPAALDPAWEKPVSDIKKLLPAAVTGFSFGQVLASETDAELPIDPVDRTLRATVSSAQLSVHDRGSSESAEAYVTQHSGTLYKQHATTVDVNGTQAKSGTDTGRMAAVIFSRGRFAFEVVVTGKGSDPATVMDVAVAVAKSFPTKP